MIEADFTLTKGTRGELLRTLFHARKIPTEA